MTASKRFVPASVFATSGISNAPGTRTTSISSCTTPCFVSPSTQLLNSLLVTNLLNLATTIPNFNPVALWEPLRSFIGPFYLVFSAGLHSPQHVDCTPPASHLFQNVP